MDQLNLPEEQMEKLRQFTEITNMEDFDVAIGTLASLNWNVERAIEAHLMQDDVQDDPEIVEVPQSSRRVAHQPTQPLSQSTSSTGRGRRRGHEETVDNQVKRLRINDDDEDDEAEVVEVPSRPRRGGPSTRSTNVPQAASNDRRRVTRASARNGASATDGVASGSSSASSSRSQRNGRSAPGPAPAPEAAPVVDSDDDDMRLEYEYDVDVNEIANDLRQNRPRNGAVPLIPADCEDVSEALQNFVSVFENRYCSTPATSAFMPHFYTESLPAAIKEAFDKNDVSMRRPLALYVHNEQSIAVNIFATQVLCSEAISSLLRHQYVFWPWDVTIDVNLAKLCDWLQLTNMNEPRQVLQRRMFGTPESFPMIFIVVREKGSFQLVDLVTGMETQEAVMEKLMQGIDNYSTIRVKEAADKREREEREALRNQQEAEYEASLAADKARYEAKQREIDEQKRVEDEKRRAEEEEQMRRQTVASLLPEEPSANETDIVHVKFRLPEGAQDMRRFRKAENVKTMIDYLSSKGFAPETFKYFNSDFPKKDVGTHFDLSKTFADVSWPMREQIFVEEI